jgi:ankyrin repeat protein
MLLQMGQTPLHVAALWGNLDAIKALIQAGANVSAQNMRCGMQ